MRPLQTGGGLPPPELGGPGRTGRGFVPGAARFAAPPPVVETRAGETGVSEEPSTSVPPSTSMPAPIAEAPPAGIPPAAAPSVEALPASRVMTTAPTTNLTGCAARFAWMFQPEAVAGRVIPIAVRNILDGCVELGYAGDDGAPKRLHLHVLRPDGLPDTHAQLSALVYPRTNVDAGTKLNFQSHGDGKFLVNFDPASCDGDTLAVRVKRAGMKDQVAYFSLLAAEIPSGHRMTGVPEPGSGPAKPIPVSLSQKRCSACEVEAQPAPATAQQPRATLQRQMPVSMQMQLLVPAGTQSNTSQSNGVFK